MRSVNRRKRPAAETAAQETQDGHTEPEAEALLSEADQFAADAERLRSEAREMVGQAQQKHDKAQAHLAEAQQQAAQMIAEAKAAAIRAEWTDLRAAERKAAELEGRASYFARAAQLLEHEIPEADQRVSSLQLLRETLTTQVADLGAKLASGEADRGRLAAELDAARERDDLEAIRDLRGRVAAVDDLAASHARNRAAAQARLLATGDEHRGELADAAGAAGRWHAELRQMRNHIDPDRPEATEDRKRAEWQAVAGAQREWLAEQSRRQSQSRVAYLG